MGGFSSEFWQSGQWITPAIHLYSVVVFALLLLIYFVHHARQTELARRVAAIADLIEGNAAPRALVRPELLTGYILNLRDRVEERQDFDLGAVLEYVRREDRHRSVSVMGTLVNLTQTMMELFPMLGIFGTVWAISGIKEGDLGGPRLLLLFGVAISTTLYALLYVIIFRIAYSAFVHAQVDGLDLSHGYFQEFLALLERLWRHRNTAAAPGASTRDTAPGASRA